MHEFNLNSFGFTLFTWVARRLFELSRALKRITVCPSVLNVMELLWSPVRSSECVNSKERIKRKDRENLRMEGKRRENMREEKNI